MAGERTIGFPDQLYLIHLGDSLDTKKSESREVQIACPSLGSEEVEALKQTIESGWITQGSQVADFEQVFAKRHGAKYAVATSSCTTGLHLILKASLIVLLKL